LIVGGIAGVALGGFNWALGSLTPIFLHPCQSARHPSPSCKIPTLKTGWAFAHPDCHSQAWIYKIIAKIEATTDLYLTS
jgi:hypothetical protein